MSFTTPIEESDATGVTAEMYASERERVGYLPRFAKTFPCTRPEQPPP